MSDAARVLVTRPSGQCESLCAQLERAGFDARGVPVIDIVPAADPAPAQAAFAHLRDASLLIFVSRNAVRHALPLLPDLGAIDARLVAVGPSTAEALAQAGLRCDVTPADGFTSEALLAHEALNEVAGTSVVIARGEGGRALLGDTLRARGATVRYAEVYRREIPSDAAGRLNDQLAMGIDALTATSVETLSNIDALARPEHRALLMNVTVVTASERVLKKARALGYTGDVVLADAPDDAALVNALVRWRDANAPSEPENASMASDNDDAKRPDNTDDAAPDATFDEAPDRVANVNEADDTVADAADEIVEETVAETVEETVTEPTREPPATVPEPVAAEASSGGGRGLGLVAIALALAAGGIGGLAFKKAGSAINVAQDAVASTQNAEDPRVALNEVANGLRGDIEGIRDGVSDTADDLRAEVERKLSRINLDPVTGQLDELANQQASLDRRLSGQKRAFETVTDRLGEMEGDLAALQGVSDTVRNTWVRAEAEYFLQTANSRLQLAGDVRSALSALRAADERIGALGDPGLIPIRAKITEEILAVEAVPLPDIEGTALALLGMAERVTELPLIADEVPQRYDAGQAPDTGDATGWQRVRDKVSGAFSDIVRISPSDGSSVQVVAPEDAFFIFRNLELQLAVARLALLRQDQANYTGSIEAASAWLNTYFDTSTPAVSNMLTRLEAIKDLEIDPEVPDISESLRMLRILVKSSNAS